MMQCPRQPSGPPIKPIISGKQVAEILKAHPEITKARLVVSRSGTRHGDIVRFLAPDYLASISTSNLPVGCLSPPRMNQLSTSTAFSGSLVHHTWPVVPERETAPGSLAQALQCQDAGWHIHSGVCDQPGKRFSSRGPADIFGCEWAHR